jgi:hypothetical protein
MSWIEGRNNAKTGEHEVRAYCRHAEQKFQYYLARKQGSNQRIVAGTTNLDEFGWEKVGITFNFLDNVKLTDQYRIHG